MNVFAGFWVDGAVRKPEKRHFDKNGWVIANWKDAKPDLDVCRNHFEFWDEVYWLDTTPRESMTPAELFSTLKVLWPNLQNVDLATDGGWCVANNQTSNETAVSWNGIERYPPPAEPQWIRITRENVGQYLFRECRFKGVEEMQWKSGTVAGWDEQDKACLVNSDFSPHIPIMQWNIVEVKSESI